ncbi:MAG: hypothetical protein AAFQ37_03000, partial [Bacteroidota bacterium]
LLDRLEILILKSSVALREANRIEAASTLINNYLSHLQDNQLFTRTTTISLIREMHKLEYDPVVLSGYANIIAKHIRSLPAEELTNQHRRILGTIQFYLENGAFPAAGDQLPSSGRG